MKKKLLTLIIILLLIPIKTNALTGASSITCDKTQALPGENITCSLTGSISDISEDTVASYQGTIILSEGLELVSVTKDSIWGAGDNNSPNLNFSEAADNVTGNFNIAQIIVKASENISATTNASITIGAQTLKGNKDTEGKSLSGSPQSIKILSNNNNLKTLTISSGELSPAFNSSTTDYNITCNQSKIIVSATSDDSEATIEGNGEHELNYGANVVNVVVKSSSGQSKTYKLNITRPDGRSTTNTISRLILNGSEIEIKNDIVEFEVKYAESVKELVIEAELTDPKSNFVEGYGDGTEDLQKGTNIFEIKVQSEAGAVRTYKITAIRGNTTEKPQNTTNNSQNNNNNNSSSTPGLTNPKTGNTFITIILIILIISIVAALVYYNKFKKDSK